MKIAMFAMLILMAVLFFANTAEAQFETINDVIIRVGDENVAVHLDWYSEIFQTDSLAWHFLCDGKEYPTVVAVLVGGIIPQGYRALDIVELAENFYGNMQEAIRATGSIDIEYWRLHNGE